MQLEELLANYQEAELDLVKAQDHLDLQKNEIVQWLQQHEKKSEYANVDDHDYKVTMVTRETVKFDEATLMSALGKRRFARVAKLKIDRSLLEQAVASGEIDANLVANCTVVSTSAPFLRISPYIEEEGKDDGTDY
jgi:DNA integrity scanning protein DisA with diadenylate cyclase activity